ncbi:tetratricopeptide repeat protein [Verrucomicrobiota bacterium]
MNRDQQFENKCIALWKQEQKRILWSRIIRWGIAIPLFLFSYPRLGWLGPFFILAAAMLVASDIAGYLSRLIIRTHRPTEPKPIYGIAESLVAKGKYAEAEQEYEKIIQEFPNEIKPHIDMINIAVKWLNNGQLAEQSYQRGMSLLRNPVDRNTLTETYTTIRTLLKNQNEENTKVISLEKINEVKERLARDRHKLWR